MTALPLSKRVAALMAAGAVAAACGIVAAMPAQAHAATNLTLDNVKNLPFYDAGHTAAKPVWKSTSKVIAVGGCKQCASIWYDERAWDIQKAGNGILLSDVGTDLDGDPYDIKIVAKSVKGVHTDKGTVSLDVRSEDYSKVPQAGQSLCINISSMSQGEATFTVSYLKHGASKAASVKGVSCVYDIDAWNWGIDCPDLMFNGNEGVSFANNEGACYVTYSKTMSVNASKGTFCNIASTNTGSWGSSYSGYGGKDLNGAVVALLDSSSYGMTFSGSGAGIDMYFDTQEVPDNPHKEAKVMMNDAS